MSLNAYLNKKLCRVSNLFEHVPRNMFDHFDEYYDYYVLGKGTEPTYDSYTDYCQYLNNVLHSDNTTTIGCFR